MFVPINLLLREKDDTQARRTAIMANLMLVFIVG